MKIFDFTFENLVKIISAFILLWKIDRHNLLKHNRMMSNNLDPPPYSKVNRDVSLQSYASLDALPPYLNPTEPTPNDNHQQSAPPDTRPTQITVSDQVRRDCFRKPSFGILVFFFLVAIFCVVPLFFIFNSCRSSCREPFSFNSTALNGDNVWQMFCSFSFWSLSFY